MRFQTKERTKKVHVNTASLEEKEDFKNRLQNRYLWISSSSNNMDKKRLYHSICVDESFFLYDSCKKGVWIDEKKTGC
jgi:hypothetical protein